MLECLLKMWTKKNSSIPEAFLFFFRFQYIRSVLKSHTQGGFSYFHSVTVAHELMKNSVESANNNSNKQIFTLSNTIFLFLKNSPS